MPNGERQAFLAKAKQLFRFLVIDSLEDVVESNIEEDEALLRKADALRKHAAAKTHGEQPA